MFDSKWPPHTPIEMANAAPFASTPPAATASPSAKSRKARHAPAAALTPSVLSAIVIVADALAILGASYLAFQLWLRNAPQVDWPPYALVAALGSVLALNCFAALGLHRIESLARPNAALLKLLGALALVGGMLLALSYFTKTSDDFSRAWAGLWFLAAYAGVAGNRAVTLLLIRRGPLVRALSKRAVVIGEKTHVERLLRQVTFSNRNRVVVTQAFWFDSPQQIDWDALDRSIRADHVDTVIVATPWGEEDGVLNVLGALYQFPVDVLLCPRGIGLSLIRPRVHYVADIPMLTLATRPLSGWRHVIKAIEDRVLAAVFLLLLAPVLLGIAVLIRIDSPGPVLFRQKRFGFNNQLIEVLKFRTMYADQSDHNAEQLTRRGDPRVTRIGRILRATSLDELPQLLNVLRGEMSIVGPRPHAIAAKAGGRLYQEAVQQYAARHRVKPGITGWAQVNGWRGETETVDQIRRRVHHDIAYIDDWSLWLDLKIILLTAAAVFTRENAY